MKDVKLAMVDHSATLDSEEQMNNFDLVNYHRIPLLLSNGCLSKEKKRR